VVISVIVFVSMKLIVESTWWAKECCGFGLKGLLVRLARGGAGKGVVCGTSEDEAEEEACQNMKLVRR